MKAPTKRKMDYDECDRYRSPKKSPVQPRQESVKENNAASDKCCGPWYLSRIFLLSLSTKLPGQSPHFSLTSSTTSTQDESLF